MESSSGLRIQRTTTKQRKRVKSVIYYPNCYLKMIQERQICIDYHRTGSCRFGENCKYQHGEYLFELCLTI